MHYETGRIKRKVSAKDNDRMPPFFDPQSYSPTWHLIF